MKSKMFTKTCPSVDTLSQLVAGTVENIETLEAHLKICDACCDKLDSLSQSDILRQFRKNESLHPGPGHFFLGNPLREDDLGSIEGLCIESEIGRGGAGVVFKAFDPALERFVAVKVLNNEGSFRSDARFERESKAAGNLRNDYLVTVHSTGRTHDGRPYLVMPLVPGETLRELLGTKLPDNLESARIIRQIAIGLEAVHVSGLIHRDVKPANILMDTDDGRAKLTDFGLARKEISEETLTQADILCGTPEYMSPEQISGIETTSGSDVYSLGITLYECLTGTTPFRGQPLQVLQHHQQTEPIPPSRLNPGIKGDLETICLKSISKLPEYRYETAREFADDLQRFIEGRPILARPVSPIQKLWLWAKRNRSLAALAATSLGLLLILAVGSSVTAWQLSSANSTILNKTRKATAAEKLASNDRSAAIDALATLVDSFYDELSNDAATIKTREKVVTAAIDGLKSITQVAGDHQADRTIFQAYLRIGDLTSLRGASQEAEDNYNIAIELGRTLLQRNPDDASAKRELAMAISKLGLHFFRLGKNDAADLSQESIALLTEVLDANPDDFDALVRLVSQHGYELEIIQQAARNDPTEIIEYGEAVLPDVERLFELKDDNSMACEAAHTIHFCLGRAYVESNKAAKAGEHFATARYYLDKVIQQSPENVKLRSASSVLDRSRAMVAGLLGQLVESTKLFETSLETFKGLSAANPDDRVQKQNVANTQNLMSLALEFSGRHKDAIQSLNDAIVVYEDLLDHSPDDDTTRILIADTRFKTTASQLSLNRWAEASETYAKILHELDDHDFDQALAASVQFFQLHACLGQEAMARLLGKTTDVETSTGQWIALMFAVRKDSQTSQSVLLSSETIELISAISPGFDGNSFDDLFAHAQSLTDVDPFYGGNRRRYEARVHGFLARNFARSDLPNAQQLSSQSLNRSVSILMELAAEMQGAASNLILNDPDLKWVFKTPQFEAAWAEIVMSTE